MSGFLQRWTGAAGREYPLVVKVVFAWNLFLARLRRSATMSLSSFAAATWSGVRPLSSGRSSAPASREMRGHQHVPSRRRDVQRGLIVGVLVAGVDRHPALLLVGQGVERALHRARVAVVGRAVHRIGCRPRTAVPPPLCPWSDADRAAGVSADAARVCARRARGKESTLARVSSAHDDARRDVACARPRSRRPRIRLIPLATASRAGERHALTVASSCCCVARARAGSPVCGKCHRISFGVHRR